MGRLGLLVGVRPGDRGELKRFVEKGLGLQVSGVRLDYLAQAFFEDGAYRGDVVVWANRGGGKTLLGAVATLLDLVFKPGIQVRILGGSLEQSARMYAHLLDLLERPLMQGVVEGVPTQRRIRLKNGSVAEVLAQSNRSVRGTRVHKLRCDEVDEFKLDVWQAAQLTTRSGWCGDVYVHGSIEALSTMHRPMGLMAGLAEREDVRVFRWNYLDVMDVCEAERECEGCGLWRECQGSAKLANGKVEKSGYVPVEELLRQRDRSSDDLWLAEMVCERPRVSDRVYPNFDLDRHVQVYEGDLKATRLVGGMDFGIRSPLMMVWGVVEEVNGSSEGKRLHIVAEHGQEGLTLEQHLAQIDAMAGERGLGDVEWLGVDPAGHQRNAHSGMTDVQLLKRAGYRVRSKRSRIAAGIEMIRRRLDRGLLLIDPSCKQLIAGLLGYHFDGKRLGLEEPVKDGPDHVCDAVRYLVVNLDSGGGEVVRRRYVG